MDEAEVKAWIKEAMKVQAETFLSSEEGLQYQSDVYAGFGALIVTEDGKIERVSPKDLWLNLRRTSLDVEHIE